MAQKRAAAPITPAPAQGSARASLSREIGEQKPPQSQGQCTCERVGADECGNRRGAGWCGPARAGFFQPKVQAAPQAGMRLDAAEERRRDTEAISPGRAQRELRRMAKRNQENSQCRPGFMVRSAPLRKGPPARPPGWW